MIFVMAEGRATDLWILTTVEFLVPLHLDAMPSTMYHSISALTVDNILWDYLCDYSSTC